MYLSTVKNEVMKAEITEVNVSLGNGLAMSAYRVDWENFHIEGYHESVTMKGTFGVYERREIAEYVKMAIDNGEIMPIGVEVDHTYPDD